MISWVIVVVVVDDNDAMVNFVDVDSNIDDEKKEEAEG